MLRNAAWPDGIVRPATPDDFLPWLCCARLVPRSSRQALFSAPARVWCLLADCGGELIGYATYNLEFSTWLAAEYVHLDCLFAAERRQPQLTLHSLHMKPAPASGCRLHSSSAPHRHNPYGVLSGR
ncbi:hypothetical protein OHT93_36785 [Streptomyces sp. NBC_00191]|uniref:hypothetical protein n=1 Tax=Streptomyces sp. NBC_00191 TaxID=2975674 RepID=UPI00324F10BF